MAATDVIFRIGTIGVTKAQAEMGVVVAVLVKVAQAIKETIVKADEFSDTWSRLSEAQRTAALNMDTATKGMVGGMEAAKNAARLGAAQFRGDYGQALSAIGRIAADTAQRLGEGPEGAARRAEQLTEALVKGNARALKPYGIELSATGTLSEKQAEAFAKLTQRAEGLTISVEDLDDALETLGKRTDTMIGLTYDWATKHGLLGSAIQSVSDEIAEVNKVMAFQDGAVLDAMTTWDGYWKTLESGRNTFAALAFDWIPGVGDALRNLSAATNEAYINWMRMKVAMGAPATEEQIGTTTAVGSEGVTDYSEDWMYETSPESILGAKQIPGLETPEVPKKKGGGGGGRAPRAWEAVTESLYFPEAYSEIADLIGPMADDTERLAFATNEWLLGIEGVSQASQEAAAAGVAGFESEPNEDNQVKWDAELEAKRESIALLQEEMEYKAKAGDLEAAAFLKSQKAIKESKAQLVLHGAAVEMNTRVAGQLFKAMWDGSISSGKAVRKMIAEIMQGMSIEYGVKAVANGVEALISIAKQDYAQAAEFATAAAAAAAVAVMSAGAAIALGQGGGTGISGGSRPGGGGGGGGFGGGGAYSEGGGYSGGAGNEPVEVKIFVEGSMSGLFNNLRVESRRQKKSGEWGGGF